MDPSQFQFSAMDPSQFQNQINYPQFQNPRSTKPHWRRNNSNNFSFPGFAPTQEVSYHPPPLHDLQYRNRLKARRFFPKKRNRSPTLNPNHNPRFAPRNTTSFIIRAKKSGGIASLVSPCPVTPAILQTPKFSPNHEGLVELAKEEWGVDGYGSMNGLIRLRSPKGDEEDEDEGELDGSSDESDMEEHVEVERRLDHDLSRFEMVYPVELVDVEREKVRVERLEEENLTLKERLFLMETELGEMRERLTELERRFREINGDDQDVINGGDEIANEEEVTCEKD